MAEFLGLACGFTYIIPNFEGDETDKLDMPESIRRLVRGTFPGAIFFVLSSLFNFYVTPGLVPTCPYA